MSRVLRDCAVAREDEVDASEGKRTAQANCNLHVCRLICCFVLIYHYPLDAR